MAKTGSILIINRKDIWQEVLSFLDCKSIFLEILVICKRFHEIIMACSPYFSSIDIDYDKFLYMNASNHASSIEPLKLSKIQTLKMKCMNRLPSNIDELPFATKITTLHVNLGLFTIHEFLSYHFPSLQVLKIAYNGSKSSSLELNNFLNCHTITHLSILSKVYPTNLITTTFPNINRFHKLYLNCFFDCKILFNSAILSSLVTLKLNLENLSSLETTLSLCPNLKSLSLIILDVANLNNLFIFQSKILQKLKFYFRKSWLKENSETHISLPIFFWNNLPNLEKYTLKFSEKVNFDYNDFENLFEKYKALKVFNLDPDLEITSKSTFDNLKLVQYLISNQRTIFFNHVMIGLLQNPKLHNLNSSCPIFLANALRCKQITEFNQDYINNIYQIINTDSCLTSTLNANYFDRIDLQMNQVNHLKIHIHDENSVKTLARLLELNNINSLEAHFCLKISKLEHFQFETVENLELTGQNISNINFSVMNWFPNLKFLKVLGNGAKDEINCSVLKSFQGFSSLITFQFENILLASNGYRQLIFFINNCQSLREIKIKIYSICGNKSAPFEYFLTQKSSQISLIEYYLNESRQVFYRSLDFCPSIKGVVQSKH